MMQPIAAFKSNEFISCNAMPHMTPSREKKKQLFNMTGLKPPWYFGHQGMYVFQNSAVCFEQGLASHFGTNLSQQCAY